MRLGLVLALVVVLAACQTPPPATEVKPATTPEAPRVESLPAVQPAPPPVVAPAAGPPPGSPAARAQAQKLALQAAELLQDGDEEAAHRILNEAGVLDPENRIASSLLRQITADPATTLGAQSFPYTVARGESLSRVAQRFLGDIYQFYILARYNGIKVPRLVQAGQVIRIPGKAPPATAATASTSPAGAAPASTGSPAVGASPATGAGAPATAPAAEPPKAAEAGSPAAVRPAPLSHADRLYQAGVQALAGGDKSKAQASFAEVARLEPGYRDAAERSDALRRELVDRHHRNALAAFHRQDMTTAVREWDKVLEIDPNNQSARVNRQRALDLSKRIQQIK